MALHCGGRGAWHLARTSLTLAADTTPDAFAFTDMAAAALGVTYESNAIVVSGVTAPANLTVSGGQYSINGATYASTATTVNNGDTVKVQRAAAATVATGVDVTLTIGGVSDTFTITTVANGETSTLLGRFSVDPGAARRGAIDTLVGALKAASLWSKIDVLQVYAAHDAQASLLNWSSTSFTASGSSGFVANQGYAGDGAATFVDTGFLETTGSVNFQASAGVATIAFGVSGSVAGASTATNYAIGLSSAGSLRFNPSDGANFAFRFLGSTDKQVANTGRAGRYLVTRDATPVANVYKNGALLGSVTPSAVATSAGDVLVLKTSAPTFSDSRIQYLMIGGANLWSATDAANFDSAIAAYLSAVGAT